MLPKTCCRKVWPPQDLMKGTTNCWNQNSSEIQSYHQNCKLVKNWIILKLDKKSIIIKTSALSTGIKYWMSIIIRLQLQDFFVTCNQILSRIGVLLLKTMESQNQILSMTSCYPGLFKTSAKSMNRLKPNLPNAQRGIAEGKPLTQLFSRMWASKVQWW